MHDSNACARRASFPSFLFPAIVVLILLNFSSRTFGQAGDASISGRVSDPAGRIVQQAEVTIKNVATNVKAVTATNEAGIYTFPSLPPGNYVLTVHKQGFQSVDLVDLKLYTQDRIERNFTFSVGSASESVTVNGGATNDSPAVSMTVDREFVEDMPLNGRSFQDLIQLSPGTVDSAYGYVFNGQRYDSNNFTVDGVSANLGGLVNHGYGSQSALSGSVLSQTALQTTQSLTSVDDLQEFKIQTSGYAAEFGRNPGGQVEFATRSGSNNVHGMLFDYLRNTDFDANSFSNDYYKVPQTPEHQNDFGGTFGGPLLIPRLYNGKDKTFFFMSYEGLRLLLPSSQQAYYPTQAFINAASPNVQPFLMAVPAPNTSTAGDSCTVSGNTINPTGLANPNGSNTPCDEEFYAGYSYPNNLDNYSGRIDQNFGRRFHGFARFADTPSSVTKGLVEKSPSIVDTHSWTAGLTTTISSALLDELRFNYSHDGEHSETLQTAYGLDVPFANSLLIPAAYNGPYAFGAYYIEVPNTKLSMSGSIANSGTVQHQYQVVDSLAWTKGVHSVKFGADWRRLTPIYSVQPYASQLDIESLNGIQKGSATYLYVTANEPGEPVFHNLSLYAQDDWRINSRLTLDYGLRWDFNPPPGPSNGFYPVALTSDDLTTTTLTTGSQPYHTDYHSFGPRFGFAWNAVPTSRHSITVRGGFGIFYDTAQQEIAAEYENAYPFGAQSTQTNVVLPLSGAALAPPSLSDVLKTPYPEEQTASPNLTAPYTEQWNLSVDEALNPKNTLTVSYVGNEGKKLMYTADYNGVPGNPDFPTILEVTGNESKSNYNALQVQDVGRILNGLDIVASFTLAHALDNASTDTSLYVPVYGNSDNDLRKVLNIALNYRSSAVGSDRLIQRVTGGWTLSNRLSAQSGLPMNINETEVLLPDHGFLYYAPNLVPGVPIYLHGTAANGSLDGWQLNRAAFACTTTGATSGACTGTPTGEGSLGRNYVRVPPFWSLNSSVQRALPIYEQLHLDFRVDAFNVFNHPNLEYPNTTLSSSTFGALYPDAGTIGSANQLYAMGSPRSLQFSLKLVF